MSATKAKRKMAWVAIAIAVVGLLGVAAFDTGGQSTEVERVQRLSQTFACPECDGQSVAESNAAVAANIRDFIRLQVSAGATDEQIRNQLLQNYGTDVLLTPPAEGISALVWILPAVVATLGVAGVVAAVRRSGGGRTASSEDMKLVAAARESRVDSE